MKCNNIHIIGIPKGKEKEEGIENLFEKMTDNFPNLLSEKLMPVQEVIESPNRDEPKEAHYKTH